MVSLECLPKPSIPDPDLDGVYDTLEDQLEILDSRYQEKLEQFITKYEHKKKALVDDVNDIYNLLILALKECFEEKKNLEYICCGESWHCIIHPKIHWAKRHPKEMMAIHKFMDKLRLEGYNPQLMISEFGVCDDGMYHGGKDMTITCKLF